MAIIGKGVFIPPTSEDNRIFATRSAAEDYLETALAKAGQNVMIYDSSTDKYKKFIIQEGSNGLELAAGGSSAIVSSVLPAVADGDPDMDYYIGEAISGANSVIAASLPSVSEGDADKDYYIGTAGTGYLHYRFVDNAFVLVDGYTHYRFINGAYIAVGGDNSGMKSDIEDINTAIEAINSALAGKGVALVLDGNTLTLVDSNQIQLGEAITLPQSGITSLFMQTVNEQVEGETKTFLEILESEQASVPLARCELPAMGDSASSLDYNTRLYNKTGHSTTFTTSATGITKVTISFHETDIDGVQTAQSGNITVYYKNHDAPDTAYRIFRELIIPQDTDTDIDVSALTNIAGTTTDVKIYAYGSSTEYSRNLVFTISAVEVGLYSRSATFPTDTMSTSLFTANSTATLLYEPVGNKLHKTMHFIMDGDEMLTDPVDYDIGTASNVRKSIVIDPVAWELSYGAHYFHYYFTTSEGATSPVLYNVFLYNDGTEYTPILAIDKSVSEVALGEVIKAQYVIRTPGEDTTDEVVISLLDSNNNVIKSVTHTDVSATAVHDAEFGFDDYRNTGTFTIKIQSGSVIQTHSLRVTNVDTEGYEIMPISDNLVYAFTAAGHSNSDVDKETIVHRYGQNNVYATNDGFNWNSNGYISTEYGTALRLNGSAVHTIQIPILSRGFTNSDNQYISLVNSAEDEVTTDGRTIEIDYLVEAASDDDATIIDCSTAVGNDSFVGFQVTPLTCALKSRDLQRGVITGGFITDEVNVAGTYLQKGERIHLSFVVNGINASNTDGTSVPAAERTRNKQTVDVYVNGSYVKSIPYDEDDIFDCNSNITFGTDVAIIDLFSVRLYKRALTRKEIQQNYCASKATIAERINIAKFNDVTDANGKVDYNKARKKYTCLKLTGEMAPDKETKKYASVVLTRPNTSDAGFETLLNLQDVDGNGRYVCSNKVQGTSSQRFMRKNYKVYLAKYSNGEVKKVKFPLKGYSDGTYVYDSSKADLANSIPESTLCFKMDYMSTDHSNTYNANMADGMYEVPTAAQVEDPRIQNTVYGFKCLLFVDDATGLHFAGEGMLNNDKGNAKSYGLESPGDTGANEGDTVVSTKKQKWEMKNNTTDLCLFKTDNFSNATDGLESCYPDEGDLNENGLTPDYSHLQVLYTWVYQRANYWDESDSSRRAIKKQRFIDEFALHFDKKRALTYYCFLEFTALVDNHAKNMFLRCEDVTTEDIAFAPGYSGWDDVIAADGSVNVSGIDWANSTFAVWIPDLYDLDSGFGAENSGYLKIPYYADWQYYLEDDGRYGFNGHESRLWLMFEDCFADDIRTEFARLANANHLTYSNFKRVQITNGTDPVCGEIVNSDMEYKYDDPWVYGYTRIKYDPNGDPIEILDPTTGQVIGYEQETAYTDEYKYMQRGSRKFQKDMFIYKRSRLLNSKYRTNEFYNDNIAFRSGVASDDAVTLSLEAMQYMYPAVGLNQVTNPEAISYPDVGGRLVAPNTTVQISRPRIGSTDNLYVYGASEITKLNIAAFKPFEPSFMNAKNLRELVLGRSGVTYNPGTLNLSACSMLEKLDVRGLQMGGTLDLSDKDSLQEVLAENSTFTNIKIPNGGLVNKLHLPSTITSLEMKNQNNLTDFTCQGYSNITSLIIENTPNINAFEIMTSCLTNLTGLRLVGINENIGNDENNILRLLLSDAVKGKYIDANGRRVVDPTRYPYISGTITVNDIGTNTKARLEEVYPHLTINSVNTPYTQYTVDYVIDGIIVDSQEADIYNNFTATYNASGELSTYPTKASAVILGVTHYYLFNQWVVSGSAAASAIVSGLGRVTNVGSNLTITATFTDCTMPAEPHEIPTGGYLYHSSDPALSAYTLGEFYAICKSNVLDTVTTNSRDGYFKIGDQIYIQLDDAYSGFSNGHLIFDIIGLRHYRKAIGEGFANIVFACHNVVTNQVWNSRGINTGGWAQSQMRYWLNGIENTQEPWSYMNGAKLNEYYYNDTGTDANGVVTPSNTSTLYQTYSLSMWARIPYQLRVMIETVKVIGNNGAQATAPTAVTTTNDKLFLFAYYEVFGNAASSYDIYLAEVDSEANATYKYFPFFVNNNTVGYRIKTQEYSTSGQTWWLRTPVTTSGSNVWFTNSNGSAGNNYSASYSYGVVFGFCI